MSLIRQACACLRSEARLAPTLPRVHAVSLSTSAGRFNNGNNDSGSSRRSHPPPNQASEGESSGLRPGKLQRQRNPGTSRKHTPSAGFSLPEPGPPRERGGSKNARLVAAALGGRGSGEGRLSAGQRYAYGRETSGLPRSTRYARAGDENARAGSGFGLGSRKAQKTHVQEGEYVMRRNSRSTGPQVQVDELGGLPDGVEKSQSGRGAYRAPGAEADPLSLLDGDDLTSALVSRGGKGRDADRHAPRSRGPVRGRGGHGREDDLSGGRSSRSLLDRLDNEDEEFTISRSPRSGAGPASGSSGGREKGRSHKANARAAQQAILYGNSTGEGRAKDQRNSKEDGPAAGAGVAKGKGKQVENKVERKVFIPSSVSVGRLADIFGVKIFNLQNVMRKLDLGEEQRRSDYLLTSEQACDLAIEYDLDPVVDDEAAFDIFPESESSSSTTHPLRPPVVTIMGHVDHGKTTLLDSLRRTSVAAGEAGGITQHIGAFSVALADILPAGQVSPPASEADGPGSITFLDTPGHAAFTAMRARGASATDMVVLVVAADDGVMPQTKEVIELVRQEGDKVGLVVAINKCDKTGVDFDKVKSVLGAEGVLLEEDGGDTPSVRVSGLTGLGLDQLVETLSTLAEMRELRARKDGNAEGIVLESRVDRGRGNVATVLVQKGTLASGASIVAGTTWAKVRQMQDSSGRPLKSAGPGTPVSLTGWKDLPTAGDVLLQAPSEDLAKRAISNRLRDVERRKMLADIEQINEKRAAQRLRAEKDEAVLEQMKKEGRSDAETAAYHREIERRDAKGEAATEAEGAEGEAGKKLLNLVIKADVSGTVEAVVGSLEGIGNKEAGVKVVGTGVGEVGESDVHMAEATGATIVAFSVPVPKSIETLAASSSVPLRSSKIIYELIERVRADVAALLPPLKEMRVTGEATVQQLFDIKLKGKETMRIAGCKVSNGVVEMKEGVRARVLRGTEREVVHEGTISTLKHLKKDVTEVRKGTECGIGLEGYQDVREGDEIVTFTTVDVPRTL